MRPLSIIGAPSSAGAYSSRSGEGARRMAATRAYSKACALRAVRYMTKAMWQLSAGVLIIVAPRR